ncbi:hypothetical protein [Pantoea agglomerans]|uniref:Uncharacterized protein n=1 Tax=Enterobacter agglomerans TaxID=549 RepID=A0ACC5RS75_ENTAG|nr:hypothetical protein [Pantoea agglomerans]MBK4727572.1 hypothetical protein [Pantoea agglomerans]
MVRYGYFILLLVFAIPVAFATHVPSRKIVEIKINEVGKSEDASENVKSGCRTFVITEVDVRSFFSKSYPVPLKFNAHDRYSPCFSRGEVKFSDNTRGEWKISSSGGGTLLWDTGDVATLFYDDYQWTDPFEDTYSSEN